MLSGGKLTPVTPRRLDNQACFPAAIGVPGGPESEPPVFTLQEPVKAGQSPPAVVPPTLITTDSGETGACCSVALKTVFLPSPVAITSPFVAVPAESNVV